LKNERVVPIAYVFPEQIMNISWVPKSDEDLHIFIPDDESVAIRNASIEKFKTIFNTRERFHREYWLLDIGAWNYIADVSNDLKVIEELDLPAKRH
jgi:hypothetical protein